MSNFYKSPIVYEGRSYPTVEHAFQAAKTRNEEAHEKIRLAGTPNKAKSLGRKVNLREDWEEVKYGIMEKFVTLKFTQNKELLGKLRNIPDEQLSEYNRHHDCIWGICICEKCNGKGTDYLGDILRNLKKTHCQP